MTTEEFKAAVLRAVRDHRTAYQFPADVMSVRGAGVLGDFMALGFVNQVGVAEYELTDIGQLELALLDPA